MINADEVIAKFNANKAQRNVIADVMRFIDVGVERKYIAAQFGISEETIESIFQYQQKHGGTKAGLLAKMKENKRQLLIDRNEAIVDMYNKGYQVIDIANKFDLCIASIYKILKVNGVKNYFRWSPNE
ncbi:hypothetical protein GR173_004688 [Salmonella enterica subsp. enterica]|nr:hypothetical protein [Salmonella enterica subsp. enterica]ECB1328201.1 hypothetical protein [Salmonella enterica subsp. enterica serovar Nigeria]EDU0171501.1 hypothetical protein [Salmonella enterica subsp. enterica serovar Belfast]EEF0877425.1 hypothetical protein [Salmonella enterica subsp. enterica serovar Tafo]EEL0258265.1 hypothetical protein [Salmonella enterica]EGI5715110.1 hypothetical protein [Salmonella enterica subsp. enterica serovar Durham]EIH3027306.1 hypothetical protein [Sa